MTNATALDEKAAGPKMFYPMCRACGWSMGGLDSWDGHRCKCGKSAAGIPLSEIMKIEKAP